MFFFAPGALQYATATAVVVAAAAADKSAAISSSQGRTVSAPEIGGRPRRLPNGGISDSGVAMGWAGWAKSTGPPSAGAPEFQAKNKNNCPVTVKTGTSGYQTLECFIATYPT